jgi:hypothetical protein
MRSDRFVCSACGKFLPLNKMGWVFGGDEDICLDCGAAVAAESTSDLSGDLSLAIDD